MIPAHPGIADFKGFSGLNRVNVLNSVRQMANLRAGSNAGNVCKLECIGCNKFIRLRHYLKKI